jgi:HAD superfamily hydrolase (TIGR01549 family)
MRAIILDVDGLLVNTEETAIIHDIPFLANFGLAYTQATYAELISGKTLAALLARLNADCVIQTGKDLPVGFQKLLQDEHARQVRDIVGEVPGAVKLIDTLVQLNIPMAVASNGEMQGMIHKLQKVNLHHRLMPHIYNKDHVNGIGKPAPDMLLYAMQMLGVTQPVECIYIGDSDADMLAAKAAGMYAMGFSGGSHRASDYNQILFTAGADAVFATHQDIEAAIRAMILSPQANAAPAHKP